MICIAGGLQGTEGACKPRDCYSTASMLQTCDKYTSMLQCMKREYDGCTSNADQQSVITTILAIRRKPICGWDVQKITALMASRSDLVSSMLRRSDGTAMLALADDDSFDDDGPFGDDDSKDDDIDGPFDDVSMVDDGPYDDDDGPFDDDDGPFDDDDGPFDDDDGPFDDDDGPFDDDDGSFDDDDGSFDEDDGPFDDMGHRGLLPSLAGSPRYKAVPPPAPGIITDRGGAMMVRGSSSRHAYSGSSSVHITIATVLPWAAFIRFVM
ncbi:uncharacterized protein LOC127859805 [Dreissena polymorpha]|uniref:uncharacterized protein LOC127859805 n=1 Tax=Dreissena polymorpha TaxID=45954 RepID=UPI00226491FA|nr:uncharacterized protein LOC127859805 [Dreissena polymorpha]